MRREDLRCRTRAAFAECMAEWTDEFDQNCAYSGRYSDYAISYYLLPSEDSVDSCNSLYNTHSNSSNRLVTLDGLARS